MSQCPIILYGHELLIPPNMDTSKTIRMLYEHNLSFPTPFQFMSITPSKNATEEMAIAIIGFIPRSIDESMKLSKELSTFISQCDIINTFCPLEPRFHCGFEWRPVNLVQSFSESELDEDPLFAYEPDEEIISGSPVFPKYFS